MHNDSVDKIITRYFATVAREPFTYEGKEFKPKPLKVSPLLLRGYTCPPMCGGCCLRFSLDYLPSEPQPKNLVKRTVTFNGKLFTIHSDLQEENESRNCKYLMKDGRCANYPTRPFTCDFELIRTLQFESDDRPHVLTQKLYGRGWSYERVDGGKGALCEMTPVTQETRDDVIRKLERLKKWTDYFHLKTWLPEVIKLIQTNRLQSQIKFDPNVKGLLY